MLDDIYEIGRLYYKKEQLDELDSLLDVENINKVLLVNLIEEDNKYSYNKIIIEDFDDRKTRKYLYKQDSTTGVDITPSCSIKIKEPETNYNRKFLKWFEKNNKDNDEFYNKVRDCIINNKDQILHDLKEKCDELSSDDIKEGKPLLSLLITNKYGDKYIGDYDYFINKLKDNSREKFYKQNSKEIKGDGNCLLCGENKEVYGLVSNNVGFSFSTSEKLGNVSHGNIKNQWKMNPICGNCATYLKAGKKFIEKYSNFSEYGTTYYIIPSFLIDTEKNFDIIYNRLTADKKENSKDVYTLEEKLQHLIKNIEDILEFKFLFYKKKNSAFNILAYVEGVSPSWLNKLYSTQLDISKFNFFNEENLKKIFGDKVVGNFIDFINDKEKYYPCSDNKWYQKFLRDFFNSFSEKIYLDLVVDVLSQKKLDYNFLLNYFMKKIRSNFKNDEQYALKINVFKSLMLIILFGKLNLFRGEINMEINNDFKIEEILDKPAEKSAFYMGVLTKKLMNIQFRRLDSSPFYNKLYSLNLDYKKLKKIYPQIINKLREYDVIYPDIEEEISTNFLLADDENSVLKKEEISYYFTLGFTLTNLYSNKKSNKESDLNE